MKVCSKCGISENKCIIFEGISMGGIVSICNRCASKSTIPLIGRIREFDENGANKSVRERLTILSGNDVRGNHMVGLDEENSELTSQNALIKRVVDENLRAGVIGQARDNNFLIDNFHWVVMRARRSKCLSHKQLSEKIREPESAIAALEKGLIPPNSENLIRKLENYLAIRILKREDGELDDIESLKQRVKREGLEFDDITARSLTLEDMKELKRDSEKDLVGNVEEFELMDEDLDFDEDF